VDRENFGPQNANLQSFMTRTDVIEGGIFHALAQPFDDCTASESLRLFLMTMIITSGS